MQYQKHEELQIQLKTTHDALGGATMLMCGMATARTGNYINAKGDSNNSQVSQTSTHEYKYRDGRV